MPTIRRSTRRRAGFALEATLAVLLLLIVLSAAAATSAVGSVRSAAVDETSARVSYAADAAADQLIQQTVSLLRRSGAPTQLQLDSLATPNFANTSLAGVTVEKTTRLVSTAAFDTIRSGPFTGMVAAPRTYDVELVATDAAANRGTMVVRSESFLIPAFSFGVLYDADLEINPPFQITFLGRVHTNRNLYLCPGDRLNFLDVVSVSGRLIRQRKDVLQPTCGRMIVSRSTPAVASPLPLDLDSLPIDNRGVTTAPCCAMPAGNRAFRDTVQTRVAGRVQTVAHGVDSLSFGLPSGATPRDLIAPRSAADSPELRAVKYAWTADWVLTIPANQMGSICDRIDDPTWMIRTPGKDLPSESRCEDIFSTSTFFDAREGRTIRVLDIDMGELRSWSRLVTSRQTATLYITFTGASSINPTIPSPLGPGAQPVTMTLPAVRIHNAARLPNAMTIASSHPIYVHGDFNYRRDRAENSQTEWRPAALAGDAITFLSNEWLDSRSTWSLSSRSVGQDVFIRAAIAAGHSPTYASPNYVTTNADAFDRGSNTNYGGGLENLPRFLEQWNGRALNMRGSLVSLWPSAYTTWWWRSSYYTAPMRPWVFDTRFRMIDSLPPRTPNVTALGQVTVRQGY
ncbi:MAG: hypothetical protein SFW08_05920 [Gemmatimonadaceae bacterium]|nr:hypothetical protein [Gemmatimonadaceae bacterium]